MDRTTLRDREGPRQWWATGVYLASIGAIVAVTAVGMSGWLLVTTIALGVLASAAVLVRERYPYALLAVAWVMALVATQMVLVPALFSLGARRRTRVSLIALALTVVLLGLVYQRGERIVSIDGVDLNAAGGVLAWLLNVIAVVGVPYLLGVSLNVRRELIASYEHRATFAEQERAAREREAVLLERQRIASEAHDVLGHKLALISMQAGALEVNAASGAEAVECQAARIGQTARDGMVDLRTIIGTLDAPDAQPLTPHSLRAVPSLVDDSRASGADVTLDSSGLDSSATVPEDVGRAAYRIVQEALTNAHRHAPGSPVRVALTGAPGQRVNIEVRNRASAAATASSAGRGIPGLRERARSVGGTFTAGGEAGDFVVTAVLPWPSPDKKEPR